MEKQDFLEKLGQHIASLRQQRGLSQNELGSLIEMEKQNVNRLEKGRTNPTAYTLKKIADALEITAKNIFDF